MPSTPCAAMSCPGDWTVVATAAAPANTDRPAMRARRRP
jgi:hypothetical protein